MHVRGRLLLRVGLLLGVAAIVLAGRGPAVVAQQVRDGANQVPRDGQLVPGAPALQVVSNLRLDPTRARALLQAAQQGLDYVPGEALVRFKPGKTPAHRLSSLRTLESRTSARLVRWSGEVALVRDATMSDGRRLAATLSARDEVDYAEPNYLVRLPPPGGGLSVPMSVGRTPNAIPDDPDFDLQWNFSSIGIPEAWDINPGGRSDLVVAVVDSGVTTVDDFLVAPLWTGSAIEEFDLPVAISPQFSAARFVRGRDLVFLGDDDPVIDMLGHGTHVASTIAQATNDGLALAGIAYNVQIMPVKVCLGYWEVQILQSAFGDPGFAPIDSGFCPTDAIIAGILYAADMGARVINISLGGPGQSQAERQAVEYAVSRGAFIAMSMGNKFEAGNPVEYPAGYAPSIQGAMSVTAFGRSRTHAFYSNSGSHAEIAGPGGSSRDGASGSGLVYQTTLNDADVSPFLIVPRFDRYANEGMQGTSMATPHVSGMAALIMSQVPGISPAMVERILIAAAEDLGPPGRDDEFGYGAIRARLSLFGFGIRR